MGLRAACIIVLVAALASPGAAAPLQLVARTHTPPLANPLWVAKKSDKKSKGKLKKRKGINRSESTVDTPPPSSAPATKKSLDVLDLNAPPPPDHGEPGKPVMEPALDLSAPPPPAVPESAAGGKGTKSAKEPAGTIDFGSGLDLSGAGGVTFDFGNDQPTLSTVLGASTVQTPQRQRFEKALTLMTGEEYGKAALEFKAFQADAAFAPFLDESEYQLGKALYKLEFYDGSLKQFRVILEKGPVHKRYRKAVEWLFYMSRKLADQTPVLAELARYRNVTFPKAYRNEYDYLLSKYLFVQADDFEVKRLQEDELARGKKAKETGLDFSVIADAIGTGENTSTDFSQIGGAAGLDFSDAGSANGGFDFGSGGGTGFDFGAGDAATGGAFDFGAAPSAPPSSGAGFDFGAPTAPPAGGGSLDFAAPSDKTAPAGGALDFAAPKAKPVPSVVVVAAPTTAKEAIKQGLELVAQVKRESTFYPRAKYLTGLLHYLHGDDQKAVEAFQEVVRVLNPREGTRLDPKLRELAFLSLARIHYSYKQFNRSVYYYDLIDRDSENWLTALFEASWAYYRRGDFEKALGNLLTLHSPFFEREYFPESQIVKAIIYFEACRYPETREIVDDFIKRYTALMREMAKIAGSKDAPEELANRIAKLQADTRQDEDDVTQRVVALTLASIEIRQARAVITEEESEKKKLDAMSAIFKKSELGTQLAAGIKQASLDRTKSAGDVTRKKFEQELYKLKSLLAQALRIKIEVARSERSILEKKMQKAATYDELVPAQVRTVVDDEHVYWPYEGEYWRDELGTYELDFSMCKQVALE